MLTANRLISAQDHSRILSAVDGARNAWSTYAPYLDFFRSELRRARPLPAPLVPPDVITMNSRFALTDPESGESICYTLVYPDAGAPEAGRLSVLSPMGAALLGARVGETVCWPGPDHPGVATVRRLLYQPESDGDTDR
jgi:regulator of nucleoside diphosphate kinase